MARKLTFKAGSSTIGMDDTLTEMVERTIRQAAPTVLDAIGDTVDQVHGDAYEQWPVKTGKSKAALQKAVRVAGMTAVEGVVWNDAKKGGFSYAYTVKFKGKNTRVWNKLVAAPGKKAGEKLADDIAEDLAKVSRGER